MSNTKTEATEVNAILAGMTPEQRTKIEAAMKKVASKRTSEDEIRKLHSNVIEGSLSYNETAQKQVVKITCSITDCKETREVFTSDLHQVRTCLSHRKEQRKAARQARAAETKKLIEAGKAAQIKA
jgi:hypothetical protein